jgi:hypothetical protein
MEWIQTVLTGLILLALTSSVFYSFSYRRKREPAQRGMYAAKMNISMGLLLLLLAAMQVSQFEMSLFRMIFSTAFALIGLFNLFAGFKNRSYFRSLQNKSS